MVMIGKEFLFLTKRMITHFFSLMRIDLCRGFHPYGILMEDCEK